MLILFNSTNLNFYFISLILVVFEMIKKTRLEGTKWYGMEGNGGGTGAHSPEVMAASYDNLLPAPPHSS